MNNMSIELDSARSILKTYHQVHDTKHGTRILRSKLHQKNKELEHELTALKEKYTVLQKELFNRDERLAKLNRQLIDKSTYMTRLQEDFENAIYQLTKRELMYNEQSDNFEN